MNFNRIAQTVTKRLLQHEKSIIGETKQHFLSTEDFTVGFKSTLKFIMKREANSGNTLMHQANVGINKEIETHSFRPVGALCSFACGLYPSTCSTKEWLSHKNLLVSKLSRFKHRQPSVNTFVLFFLDILKGLVETVKLVRGVFTCHCKANTLLPGAM